MGSNSKVEKIDDRSVYELFGSNDMISGVEIFNLGGPERASRFQIAKAVFEHFGFDQQMIVEGERSKPFPLELSLDSTKLQQLTGIVHEPRTLAGIIHETFREP